MSDILLRGGTVVDGTGRPGFLADVAVEAGLIAALGDLSGWRARRELPVQGLVVAPGFIDFHSHSDEALALDPWADGKLLQGVTTEVIGNCGTSAAPLKGLLRQERSRWLAAKYGQSPGWRTFAEYCSHLERTGLLVNCVALVGHGNLRSIAVGQDDRPATSVEMAAMASMLEEALEAGAWGVSSGLIYAPSMFAPPEELAELAAVASRSGGFYSTHLRSESGELEEAVAEAIQVARATGVLVQISHHKACGAGNWGKVERTLSMMARARAEGLAVYCDQYPYAASSTGLDSVLPPWVVDGGRPAMLARLGDPGLRPRLAQSLREHPDGDWSRVLLASLARNRELAGLTVLAAAAGRACPPEELVLDLLLEEEGDVTAVFFGMCEADVERVLQDPDTVIGSDGRAHSVGSAVGFVHPRTFGTFPRVLAEYVRERRLLTLEQAIQRMTGTPAARLGLTGRGRVAEDLAADLVVFDPASLRDRATYRDPWRYPEGIRWVLVNGEVAAEAGRPAGRLAGRVLRRGREGQVATAG